MSWWSVMSLVCLRSQVAERSSSDRSPGPNPWRSGWPWQSHRSLGPTRCIHSEWYLPWGSKYAIPLPTLEPKKSVNRTYFRVLGSPGLLAISSLYIHSSRDQTKSTQRICIEFAHAIYKEPTERTNCRSMYRLGAR